MIELVRAAWHGRRVYGWQDWRCPIDRQAMVNDYNRRMNHE